MQKCGEARLCQVLELGVRLELLISRGEGTDPGFCRFPGSNSTEAERRQASSRFLLR